MSASEPSHFENANEATAHSVQNDFEMGAVEGCESENHPKEGCYGELWECAACEINICYAEGTDHDPDICDTCWADKHMPSTNQSTQGNRMHEVTALVEGQLYEIDGGVFRAKTNTDTGRIELWTHMGQSGRVIARTGFDIDDEGNLLDRVYDVEMEGYIYPVPLRFTVADLQAVSEVEVVGWREVAARQGRDDDSTDAAIWGR